MAQLRRALTHFDMTMIAIGSMIGSGIFLTPALIAQNLPSPIWVLGIWGIGGLMALAGALTFAELGGMMPQAGGMYVFLTEAYGGLVGFLFGWAYFLVVNTGGIAALGVAFATYAGYFIPLGSVGIKIFAVGGIIFLTAINVFGVKAGGVFSDIFTVLKIAAIVGVIILGVGWGTGQASVLSSAAAGTPNQLGSALAAAMVGVLWSYGGWQHATFTAGEAKDPRRSVPFAMIVGSLAVVIVYVLTNVAYMLLLPLPAIGASQHVAADAVGIVLGTAGGTAISLAIFISTFGTAGIYTLTAPRIYFAMANDGVFFRQVARTHPRYQTPATAIIIQSAWAIVLILFWGTFENLISYVVFTDWIFFGLTGASVFLFRRRRPDADRPYKTLGYPFTPIFFVGISIWFVIKTLIDRPEQAWAGIGFLAVGVPVYYYWKRKTPHPSVSA